ncbi:MAG: 30S ribosomal protein S4e [archaeon]
MTKGHLLRLNSPKAWPVKRKGITWIARARSGPHTFHSSMPLSVIMRDIIKCAKTLKEVKIILNNKGVLVNGVVVRDHKLPVGLFDTIAIPKIDEYYRMILNHNAYLNLKKIDKNEANLTLLKIKNKTMLKNKKLQLNFTNGFNLLVDKDVYKSGDTLLFDVEKKQVKEHLKFDKGALVYITAGKKASTLGTYESLHEFKGLVKDNIIIQTKDAKFETKKSYAYVVGKTKPVIDL